jgi:hypothetical protein
MVFMCVIDWILMQFPAQPKLAPIFNPVTHMVPLPFPLLLIFPAFAIDLILRKAGESFTTRGELATGAVHSLSPSNGEKGVRGILRRIGLAIILGAVFFTILILVQWYFSKFMLSPYARNWFFMSDRVFGYNFPKGEWQTQFWRLDSSSAHADPITISSVMVTLAFASASSWVGLFFGRWMRKVRR